jgi:hypothetical protein
VCCLARVGEEREPDRRIGRLREHPVGGRAGQHRVAGGERVFPVTQVFVRPGEHDLHLAEEAADDVAEAHGSQRS